MPALTGAVYGAIILSLFAVDYLLGNGFVEMFAKAFCKVVCVIKRTVKEEARKAELKGPETPVSISVLLTEVLVLIVTVMFLNKYKQQSHGRDRIDELLQESKDALKQTNEFLEKWRLRRVPTEYSYLDEEPQEIKPLKLEVPILHMAIIDTLGTTRNQPERGDAGDTCNITDSTLLSVTSLIDDDLDSMSVTEINSDDLTGEINRNRAEENRDFKTRYLWDVMEEDANGGEDD